MQTITAKFRIVTPMFIAGANQQRAELRAPSIKGALRWWYRALYPLADPEEEFRIFGGSGDKAGQAAFLLRMPRRNQRLLKVEAKEYRWSQPYIPYLGYGVIERKPTGERRVNKNGKEVDVQMPMNVRPYYQEGGGFDIEVCFRPRRFGVDEAQYKSDRMKVKQSFWAWAMLGGLGARSRNGFGSLVVENAEGMEGLPPLMPRNRDELLKGLRDFFAELDLSGGSIGNSGYPEHTCFGTQSRFVVTDYLGTTMEALEWLGKTILRYRSHRGRSPFPWVEQDHDLMGDWIGAGIKPATPPKRVAFGLPHNYFFTSLGGKKGEINLMDGTKKGRRAAPLLFHIHEFPTSGGRRQACVVATFLPARLIPEKRNVTFTSDNHSEIEELPLPDDFSAVTELLGKIADDGGNVGVQRHV